MATVEELLVRLGVDPVSVTQFIDEVNDAKNRAESEAGVLNLSLRTNAGKQIAGVTTAVSNLGRQSQVVTKSFRDGLNQVGEAAEELRGSLLAIGAVGAIGLGAAIGAAAEESRNLARANVILQFSTEELAGAQEDLRSIADRAGLTFQEVSAALFDVASAGFQGAEALAVTRAAALTARPAGTDVATAFNAIATAMTNFGFSADEASDKLVRTADITRGSLADVSEALGILGPIAGQFGISFDEIGASFALLTNRGIPAARAATSLNAAISAFISPAGEAEKALDKLGITTGDDAFETQTLVDKFKLLAEATQEGTVQIGRIFSIEALKGAAALVGATDELQKNLEAIADSSGRTEAALASFFQQTGPQLDRLGAAFINLITVVGEDFLGVLDPVIRAITEFITNNRELIAVVIELGTVFAGLLIAVTALNFIIRQLTSFQKLLDGVFIIFNSTINATTLGLKANTAATLENTVAKRGNVVSGLLIFYRSLLTALRTETTALTPNIALWLKEIAIRTFLIGVKITAFILGTIQAIILETLALATNTKGWFSNINAQLSFRAVATGTVAVIKGVGAALLSAQGVVGVLSGAFIGFQIGNFLNDFLGISDAVANFVKSSEEAAIQQERNVLTPIQTEILKEDAAVLEEFNRILKENTDLTRQAAITQALSSEARLGFLQQLSTANKLSQSQTAELATLEAELADRLEKTSREMTILAALTRDVTIARKFLKESEEEFQKILARTAKELIVVRRGQEAAQIVAAQQGAEKTLAILRQRAAAELAIVRETQGTIEQLRADDTGIDLSGLNRRLADQSDALALTLRTIEENFEIFSARVIEAGAKRISTLRQQADREIAVANRLADGVISAARRQVAEATRELDKLRAARDRGIQDAESFIERLTDAALRKVDPALAELRRFEQDAIRALSGASAAQAERAIDLIRQRIEDLAGATREETRAQQQLAALNQRIAAAPPERDVSADIERRVQLQAELIKLQELREQRAQAAIATEQAITDAAAEAAENQEDINARIEDQQQRILEANEEIAKVKELVRAKTEEIGRELDKNIQKEQRFIDLVRESVRIAKEFSISVGRLGADASATKRLSAQLDESQKRVEALSRVTTETREADRQAVGLIEQKGDDALQALADGSKATQEAVEAQALAAENVATQQDELTRIAEVAAVAQAQFTTSVDELANQQIAANQSTADFATTTTVKLNEVGDEFQKQASKISAIERELEQVRIGAEEEVSAGGLD